jgi:hypothetical protein
VPLTDYLTGQGRFRALLADPEAAARAAELVDLRWTALMERIRHS